MKLKGAEIVSVLKDFISSTDLNTREALRKILQFPSFPATAGTWLTQNITWLQVRGI